MKRIIQAILRRLNPFAGMAEYYDTLTPEQQERWWDMVHQTRPRPRT